MLNVNLNIQYPKQNKISTIFLFQNCTKLNILNVRLIQPTVQQTTYGLFFPPNSFLSTLIMCQWGCLMPKLVVLLPDYK